MKKISLSLLAFSFMALILLFSSKATTDDGEDDWKTQHFNGSIGAIVDSSSRIGKEEKVAMFMAIDDFYNLTNLRLVLHIRDCQRNPIQAAFAAMDLINEQQVQTILGVHTWEEAALVAEVGNAAHVPILTFPDAIPQWASERWPFLIRASRIQYAQMKAVAAIVGAWEWRRVTVLYEDIDSSATSVITHLSDALREVGSEIDHLSALPPFASSSLLEELRILKTRQCRVFVVHSSLPLAVRLFEEAHKLGMMTKEYIWITTDGITSLVHSFKASIISSMQGVLGIKSYYPPTRALKDFYSRFHSRFRSENPTEVNSEPGIFALQAYDAVWAIALAIEGNYNMKVIENVVGHEGQQLLDRILRSDFKGHTGDIHFIERQLAPAHTFQIVNMLGRSYREVGFWSEGFGFSETSNEKEIQYYDSMRNLGQVFWPGSPLYVPRGWAPSTSAKPLKIGVPAKPSFRQFVNVTYDHQKGNWSITGFSIDVFKAMVEQLPYYLPFDLVPFEGTYDSLVEQVQLKTFDAVVGDIAIVANRCQHAEFSHPYTESGLVMVVPVKSKVSSKAWLFMKPFTKKMWALTGAINIYNGLVVWLIERNHNTDFKGSVWNQIGTLLWISFTTLFSLHGEKVHSNSSRMAIVVWLFLSLVITQSYTASLTSLLTVEQLEPTVVDVERLRMSNAKVGCSGRSFVVNYLEVALGFHPNNIRKINSSEDYPQALRSQEIAAVFLEATYAKLFLAKHCKEFTISGPRYKIGGLGFAFPKNSPMLPDMSKAILMVSESGKLRELENNLISSYKCSNEESDTGQYSLDPNSFQGLFIISGGTSTVALIVFVFQRKWSLDGSTRATFVYKSVRGVIFSFTDYRRKLSTRIGNEGSQGHYPNIKDTSINALEMNIQGHDLESRPNG